MRVNDFLNNKTVSNIDFMQTGTKEMDVTLEMNPEYKNKNNKKEDLNIYPSWSSL